MDSPDTVVEALASLRAEGYTAAFQLVGGELVCDVHDQACPATDVEVERLYRFEGASDPGDEMIVFGLYDPQTGTRGTFASGFGPSADPEVLDHVVGMAARHRRGSAQ